MDNKVFMATVIIFTLLALLLVQLQIIGTAYGNPIPRDKPTTGPPIVIQSPINVTYQQSDIPLNFSVEGISNWWEGAYHLTDVYYECNGKTVHLNVSSAINKEQFCTNLTGLTTGKHILTVHVNGSGLYYTNYSSSDMTQYSVESIQTVTFTVDTNLETETSSASPSTSPTEQPTPTATIASTPTQTLAPSSPLQPLTSPNESGSMDEISSGNTLAATAVIIVLVSGFLVVYLVRLKKN